VFIPYAELGRENDEEHSNTQNFLPSCEASGDETIYKQINSLHPALSLSTSPGSNFRKPLNDPNCGTNPFVVAEHG
jgi:hypothetical protein